MEGEMMEIKVGDMIRIIKMKGEPAYDGRIGKVESIDSQNQLHGTWGGCAIIPEIDSFSIIKET
jgi:hypothetical protein